MSKLLRNGLLALGIAIGIGAGWASTARAKDGSSATPLDDKDKGPLNAWMKTKVMAAKTSANWTELSNLMKKLGNANPDATAYPKWKEYSEASAKAALKGDTDKDGLTAACNACHKDYKDHYKANNRSKPAPPN